MPTDPGSLLFPYTTLFRSVGAAWVTDPLAPCNVMLLYVPAVVLELVWMVNVACTDPFDGTVTCCGDHEAIAPGTCGDQFREIGRAHAGTPVTLPNRMPSSA